MSQLVQYDAARTALQKAATIDEAKQIKDQSEALALYARQRRDSAMENWVAEIKLRAGRRIGEISAGLERQSNQHKPSGVPLLGRQHKRQTLKNAGLSKSVAHRFEKIASIPEAEFETVIAEAKSKNRPVTITDLERRVSKDQKRNDLKQGETKLPDDCYQLIYADPPWRYDYSKSTSRDIENQYPTMELDDICSLSVGDIAHSDSVLFLWATSPKLREGFKVIKSWGFEYKTCAVWDKQKIGLGYYFRQQHELLLVATRGNPITPDPAHRVSSVLSFKSTAHSRKPAEVYRVLEGMYPDTNRIELFARNNRPGWSVWGNQV